MVRVAVIYFRASGTVERIARSVQDGARGAGAEVRLLGVSEFDTRPSELDWRTVGWGWRGLEELESEETESRTVPEARPEDLAWADGIVFGTPTYFGNVPAEFKRFIDSALPVWLDGCLADKPVSAFTSAATLHGGHESTLLALYQSIYHWGSLIVSTGAVSDVLREAGGNPYGLSVKSSRDQNVAVATLRAADFLGRRVASISERLVSTVRTSASGTT